MNFVSIILGIFATIKIIAHENYIPNCFGQIIGFLQNFIAPSVIPTLQISISRFRVLEAGA